MRSNEDALKLSNELIIKSLTYGIDDFLYLSVILKARIEYFLGYKDQPMKTFSFLYKVCDLDPSSNKEHAFLYDRILSEIN